MTKITVELEVSEVVTITSNDGGYLRGECLACDERGWLNGPDCFENLGTDVVSKGTTNQLHHRVYCPVGHYIARTRPEEPNP